MQIVLSINVVIGIQSKKRRLVDQKHSSMRVEFFVDFFQAGDVDVGVDLGGGNIGVAEHLLDTPQVGSAG